MNEKIRPSHLARNAVVYLRQSTIRQVHENRESTARQYALRERAVELGWPVNAVQVVDEDLGQSGSSTQGRDGFRRLGEDVAHGRVGAIIALEASRFARNSADWYRLLEICGLADVLIVDEGGVYAPRDPNDRLLLGLKGQMSEAELYWMRLRLQGGKMSKARRGDLYVQPPTGYQWDDDTQRLRLDPDEAVQRTIRMIFERFRVDGSAHAVAVFFARNGMKLPSRVANTGEIRWVSPRISPILNLLHNPVYTGTYVFGRHQERVALVNGELRRRLRRKVPREDWPVCLRDHHPAYISWDDFMANENKLHQNNTHPAAPEQRGAAREGASLLQGLVLCGKCGQRMGVHYNSRGYVYYECRSPTKHLGFGNVCWTVAGDLIDEAVAAAFLQAATPPEIELSLAVARAADKQATDVDRQWKLRLDRVHYEAKLAERRYKAVDPDNRVVARTLERDWEDKLREIEQIEREYQDVRRREKVDLTDADRQKILALARDLPRVWRAATTAQPQRKTMLRMLVREVCLTPIDIPRRTRIQILWTTGAVTEVFVDRKTQAMRVATPDAAVVRIRELVAERANNREIADALNTEGFRTGMDRPWDVHAVLWAKGRHGMTGPWPTLPVPDRRDDGAYSVKGVAAFFEVTPHVVRYWVEKGWLAPFGGGVNGHATWFQLDDATIERLRNTKSRAFGPRRPKDRSPNPHA